MNWHCLTLGCRDVDRQKACTTACLSLIRPSSLLDHSAMIPQRRQARFCFCGVSAIGFEALPHFRASDSPLRMRDDGHLANSNGTKIPDGFKMHVTCRRIFLSAPDCLDIGAYAPSSPADAATSFLHSTPNTT